MLISRRQTLQSICNLCLWIAHAGTNQESNHTLKLGNLIALILSSVLLPICSHALRVISFDKFELRLLGITYANSDSHNRLT